MMAHPKEAPTFSELLVSSRRASAAAAMSSSAPRVPTSLGKPGAKPFIKRARKDCPREISSNKPVPVGRNRCLGISDPGGSAARRTVAKRFDPRFETHCGGKVQDEHVERNFAFVAALAKAELETARRELEADPMDARLRARVRAMEAQEQRGKAEKRRKAIRAEMKAEEKEKVKRGKKPYFAREKDVRERELRMKFDELKAVGGVQKFIEKKRRRRSAKDRKYLPNRRMGRPKKEAG